MTRTADVKPASVETTLALIKAQGLNIAEIIIEPKRVRILTVASGAEPVPERGLKSWD